jgi:hypothetical protein
MESKWSSAAWASFFTLTVLVGRTDNIKAQALETPSTRAAVVGYPMPFQEDLNPLRAGLYSPFWLGQPEPLPPPRDYAASRQVGPLDLELGLVPPTPDILFRAGSEAEFRERLQKEAQQQKIKLAFPAESSFARPFGTGLVRLLPASAATSVSGLVCHQPLYFEERATEWYGCYVPWLQPAISTGAFYLDTLSLPIHLLWQAPWTWECDDLWPAPGDPVSCPGPLQNCR